VVILETFYLNCIPGPVRTIPEAPEKPIKDGTPLKEPGWLIAGRLFGGKAAAINKTRSRSSGFCLFRHLNSASPNLN
jgi:hypothetical protein